MITQILLTTQALLTFVTAMGDDESTPTAPRRKATSATTTSSASKSGSGSQQEREKARSARSGSR